MNRTVGKPPRNPVAKPLAIMALTTLAIVGIAALFGLDAFMKRMVEPLLLASALTVIVYTAFALQLGWIATVGHVGQIHHFQRDKEPIVFWLLAVLYLGLAGPTAWYMATRLPG